MKFSELFFLAFFALCVFSCNNKSEEIEDPNDENEKQDTEQPDTTDTRPSFEWEFCYNLPFTTDEIISYKITTGTTYYPYNYITGDITFTDSISDKLSSTSCLVYQITINLDDKPLFDGPMKVASPFSSDPMFDRIGIRVHYIGQNELTGKRIYQFSIVDKRDITPETEKQWDTFLNYLIETDKLVE